MAVCRGRAGRPGAKRPSGRPSGRPSPTPRAETRSGRQGLSPARGTHREDGVQPQQVALARLQGQEEAHQLALYEETLRRRKKAAPVRGRLQPVAAPRSGTQEASKALCACPSLCRARPGPALPQKWGPCTHSPWPPATGCTPRPRPAVQTRPGHSTHIPFPPNAAECAAAGSAELGEGQACSEAGMGALSAWGGLSAACREGRPCQLTPSAPVPQKTTQLSPGDRGHPSSLPHFLAPRNHTL